MILWQHKFFEERNKYQLLEVKNQELEIIIKEQEKLGLKRTTALENPSESNNSCLKSFLEHER